MITIMSTSSYSSSSYSDDLHTQVDIEHITAVFSDSSESGYSSLSESDNEPIRSAPITRTTRHIVNNLTGYRIIRTEYHNLDGSNDTEYTYPLSDEETENKQDDEYQSQVENINVMEWFKLPRITVDKIDPEECSICLETIKHPVSIPSCDHYYCYSCLQKHIIRKEVKREEATCPLCRKEFKAEDIKKVSCKGLSPAVRNAIKKK